jgi:hypothetical protein
VRGIIDARLLLLAFPCHEKHVEDRPTGSAGRRPQRSTPFRNSTRSTLNVALLASGDVRRTQVGELIKKIVVRPNVISSHLPIGEDREEEIRDVVDERTTVVRKGGGACGVIS